MKIPLQNTGFRILIVAMWLLLAGLYYLYPPKTNQYLIAVVIVAVIQGFFVAPWHYFEPGWKMWFYNLITFGGAYIACHIYTAIIG